MDRPTAANLCNVVEIEAVELIVNHLGQVQPKGCRSHRKAIGNLHALRSQRANELAQRGVLASHVP
jgi:hypothetical protein